MKQIDDMCEVLERIAVAVEELNAKLDKFMVKRFGIAHD